MLFQPTSFLNPQTAVSGCVSAVISAAVVLSLAFCLPCMADGFPGRGNQHDWSAALPYYNLGNKYMQSERYEDAIQKYHEAIGKYEYDPDFYINLGVALRRVENLQAAEDAFKHAAALNAKDWMSWSNLANSYLKQDRLEDTIKAFETALTCNPPASEKEAILKDIADIKKILSVRSGDVQPPASKNPPSAKIISGGKRGGKSAVKVPGATAPGLVKQTAKEASTPLLQQTAKEAPVPLMQQSAKVAPAPLVKQKAKAAASPRSKNEELKDTGWEDVAK